MSNIIYAQDLQNILQNIEKKTHYYIVDNFGRIVQLEYDDGMYKPWRFLDYDSAKIHAKEGWQIIETVDYVENWIDLKTCSLCKNNRCRYYYEYPQKNMIVPCIKFVE